MTPTSKHIEEARRFADHICLDTERDVVVQKIATLLAAQEELAAILERLTVDKGHCPICDSLKLEQHKCYVCNLESECAKLRENSTKNYNTSEELQAMHDAVLEDRDKLRAERDELKKREEVHKDIACEWSMHPEIVAKLETDKAALLVVARAAKAVSEIQPHTAGIIRSNRLGSLHNALSALEPLGIKVSP